MASWWNPIYNHLAEQLPKSILECLIEKSKIRGKKCSLGEDSENIKCLFENEVETYKNKKQSSKINNKRYEEKLQEIVNKKEEEFKSKAEKIKKEWEKRVKELEGNLDTMQEQLE